MVHTCQTPHRDDDGLNRMVSRFFQRDFGLKSVSVVFEKSINQARLKFGTE